MMMIASDSGQRSYSLQNSKDSLIIAMSVGKLQETSHLDRRGRWKAPNRRHPPLQGQQQVSWT